MGAPTPSQLEYIDSLLLQARMSQLQIGDIHTFDDASAAIETLLARIPISPRTRSAVFAALKDTRWTKDDLYKVCGIDSLSDGSGASEADGKRCLKWIKGESSEIKRGGFVNSKIDGKISEFLQEPASFVDGLAALDAEALEAMAASQPDVRERIVDPVVAAPVVEPRRGRPGRIQNPFAPAPKPVEQPAPVRAPSPPPRRGRPISPARPSSQAPARSAREHDDIPSGFVERKRLEPAPNALIAAVMAAWPDARAEAV